MAQRAGITFAQFVMLTPFPGTLDFDKWEKSFGETVPSGRRHADHAALAHSRGATSEVLHGASDDGAGRDSRAHAGRVGSLLQQATACGRRRGISSVKGRLAFMLISKLYRQMYANTGISTDSARVARSAKRAKWIGVACRRFFVAKPMPDLAMPEA